MLNPRKAGETAKREQHTTYNQPQDQQKEQTCHQHEFIVWNVGLFVLNLSAAAVDCSTLSEVSLLTLSPPTQQSNAHHADILNYTSVMFDPSAKLREPHIWALQPPSRVDLPCHAPDVGRSRLGSHSLRPPKPSTLRPKQIGRIPNIFKAQEPFELQKNIKTAASHPV